MSGRRSKSIRRALRRVSADGGVLAASDAEVRRFRKDYAAARLACATTPGIWERAQRAYLVREKKRDARAAYRLQKEAPERWPLPLPRRARGVALVYHEPGDRGDVGQGGILVRLLRVAERIAFRKKKAERLRERAAR